LAYDTDANNTIQVGYVHPFYETVDIDNVTVGGVHYVGTGDRRADAIGLKWVHRFGKEVG
jgi:hypothetical protein